MFADGLDEFDDAREVVMKLVEEYQASERADYATWGRPSTTSETSWGNINQNQIRKKKEESE